MNVVAKGSKSDLSDGRYTITMGGVGVRGTVDIAAVLLDGSGKVRSDNDFVFFNNPKAHGVALISDEAITVDRSSVPADSEVRSRTAAFGLTKYNRQTPCAWH